MCTCENGLPQFLLLFQMSTTTASLNIIYMSGGEIINSMLIVAASSFYLRVTPGARFSQKVLYVLSGNVKR